MRPPSPRAQRAEDARRCVQAGQHVHERHSHLVGRAVLGARDRHQPGLGLCDEVVPRAPRRTALGTEAGDRAVDDPWVALAHRVVAHAQPLRPADLEVLDHHVRGRAQLERQRPALLVGEVERAAALAAVDRQVVGGLACGERRAPAARLVAALRALHLHHVRAEVGQHHRAVGPGEHAREVRHPDAPEGRACDERAIERHPDRGRAVPWRRSSARAWRSPSGFPGFTTFPCGVSSTARRSGWWEFATSRPRRTRRTATREPAATWVWRSPPRDRARPTPWPRWARPGPRASRWWCWPPTFPRARVVRGSGAACCTRPPTRRRCSPPWSRRRCACARRTRWGPP